MQLVGITINHDEINNTIDLNLQAGTLIEYIIMFINVKQQYNFGKYKWIQQQPQLESHKFQTTEFYCTDNESNWFFRL